MPPPVISPRFATDTNFAADGDSWSGAATKLDPGAGRRAEGYEPDTLPAEWINFMTNLHGEWIKYLDDELLGSAARTIRLSPFVGESLPITGTTTPPFAIQASGSGLSLGYDLISEHDFASRIINLESIFQDGTEILNFSALVRSGAVRAGSNQTTLQFFQGFQDWTAPHGNNTYVADAEVNAAASVLTQVITVPVGIVLDKTNSSYPFIRVRAGNDGGTHVADYVYGYEITYNGPKVR